MRVLFTDKVEKTRVLIDKKDIKILSLLCFNVRLPLNKIATLVGLSRNSVDYRIKIMEQKHLITGTRTVINIKKLGFCSYHFFATINSEQDEKKLTERCLQNKFVNALISYSGKFNFELSIMAKSPEQADKEFGKIIENLNSGEPSLCILLSTLRSSVLPGYINEEKPELKHLKNDPSFAKQFELKKQEYAPDEKDLKIMHMLADNAKISLSTLGKNAGLSDDAVRLRIGKLIRAEYILHFRPAVNFDMLNMSIRTLLIKTNKGDKNSENTFNKFINRNEKILWCSETLGEWQYIIYVINKSSDEIHEFIEELKKQYSNYIKYYEILFAFKEYKYSFMAEGITANEKNNQE
jgi:DNA-binding Lrp family transcriptional regulator